MGIIRDSFIVYRDWAEGISELSPKDRLACYDALIEFGLTGQFPETKNTVARAMLKTFRREMEGNIARYNASVENGKKGGRPRKNTEKSDTDTDSEKPEITKNNLEKPRLTQTNLDVKNGNLNVNDNVKVGNIINNISSTGAHTHEEQQPYINFFQDYIHITDNTTIPESHLIKVLEFIDYLIDMRELAIDGELRYCGHTYNEWDFFEKLSYMTNDRIYEVFRTFIFADNIDNREFYARGCLLRNYPKDAKKNERIYKLMNELEVNLYDESEANQDNS